MGETRGTMGSINLWSRGLSAVAKNAATGIGAGSFSEYPNSSTKTLKEREVGKAEILVLLQKRQLMLQ